MTDNKIIDLHTRLPVEFTTSQLTFPDLEPEVQETNQALLDFNDESLIPHIDYASLSIEEYDYDPDNLNKDELKDQLKQVLANNRTLRYAISELEEEVEVFRDEVAGMQVELTTAESNNQTLALELLRARGICND